MRDTLPLLNTLDFPPLRRGALDTLQVNLTYRCNQRCLHCHVNAGPTRTESMSAELVELLCEVIDAHPVDTHGALRAGDATFHTGWVLHSAGDNPTDTLRTVMTVIYLADGARVPDELTEAQDLDRALWLGGAAPGTVIDGDDNPVLP